ncbi:terminase TerL endonuclease subunit [Liquorilactobacillus hordei]|uniref:terminase TerL endonuclease subunit n=1 Tax=Liquorilactobacillus hordei TaxID=468911 RepID=UPI0039E9AD42
MIHQKYVDEYFKLYQQHKILLNKKRIKLLKLLSEVVLQDDSLYFDEKQIDLCIRFIEKWYFELKPFQKFLTAFIFLRHKENDLLYYNSFLWLMGRGAGKNGYISGLSNYFISELHGIPAYNVSVVANSEEQAMTSVTEVYNTIESNPTSLKRAFKPTKTQITSKATKAVFKFRTSNGNTKDGLRDGCVIFDEIHQYEDDANVKVHISGLGKIKDPRQFYIGSDGYVRDGFLDKKKEIADKVLDGLAPPNLIFPWWCCLDSREEVDEPDNWEKANPMLAKPIIGYAITLHAEVERQYQELVFEPSKTEEFMTKRMDMPSQELEKTVAPYEEIKATNQKIDEKMLEGRECIGAVDFASIRDFAACSLLFRHGETYYSKHHSFVRKEFVDKFYGYSRKTDDQLKRIVVPIKDWEKQGLLSVLDEPTINPQTVVDWFVEKREKYNIKKIIMDNFRADLLRKFFEDAGFEVEVIRSPTAISALLAPRVEDGFANHHFAWGDDPMMRWYTNNVLVVIDKRGNKSYEKKEPVRRKTDGFMAFVYTLYRADEISDIDMGAELDMLASINF